MKPELDSIQQALVATKEAYRRAEEENGFLTDERLSLLMELGATKMTSQLSRRRVSPRGRH